MHLPFNIRQFHRFLCRDSSRDQYLDLLRQTAPCCVQSTCRSDAMGARPLSVFRNRVIEPSGQRKLRRLELPRADRAQRGLDHEDGLGLWVAGENALANGFRSVRLRRRSADCACSTIGRRAIFRRGIPAAGDRSWRRFLTSVSPWVNTLEALAPFTCPTAPAWGDPDPLPICTMRRTGHERGVLPHSGKLDHDTPCARPALLRIALAQGLLPRCTGPPRKMIAHHTANGCNLLPGDCWGRNDSTCFGTRQPDGTVARRQSPVILPGGEQLRLRKTGTS